MIIPGWLLLGCLAAQPAAGRSVTSERFYHSGLQSMKAREYKAAMEHFMDALLIDSDYPDARERLREAGDALLRVEKARASREREYLMVEINGAEHSVAQSRRLGSGAASLPPPEESEPASADPRNAPLPPPEEEPLESSALEPEIAPPPRPVRHARRRRKSAAAQGHAVEAALGNVHPFKETVHLDLDWLKPAQPLVGAAQPSQVPPPDTGELYLKGIRAYSAGDLASAIAAWEQCLRLEPGHAKARKALERAKREAEGGRR